MGQCSAFSWGCDSKGVQRDKDAEWFTLTYPEGTPELRLFRVEIPAGGKFPLHTHLVPMLVHVQDTNSGDLFNTRVQEDGSELSSVFKLGQAFIEGTSEPHYVNNKGTSSTVLWVVVASVEGLPTTEWSRQQLKADDWLLRPEPFYS